MLLKHDIVTNKFNPYIQIPKLIHALNLFMLLSGLKHDMVTNEYHGSMFFEGLIGVFMWV